MSSCEIREAGRAPVLQEIGAVTALTAVVVVALGLRPSIVSVGPVLPAIISEFHLTHTTASLMTSIPELLMGLFALPTAMLARRFGRDTVLLAAMSLLAASTLLRAFVSGISSLLLTTAGIGIGIAVAGALIAGFIKARFPTRAAMVMGIYATALSLGSTVAAALTAPVAAGGPDGWRLATGMWTAVVVAGVFAWLVVVFKETRANRQAGAAGKVHGLPWRNPKAWLIALFFTCVNILFYSILAWTAPMYQEAGATPGKAGLILATFTAAFTAANFLFGWLSRSEDRRRLLAASAALTAVGAGALAIAPLAAPFIWIGICAFGLGGAFTLAMTLPLDNTTSAGEANAWNAFVLMVGYVIAAAGPFMVGRLRDMTGSFTLPYQALAGVAAAMLLLTPFLRSRKQ